MGGLCASGYGGTRTASTWSLGATWVRENTHKPALLTPSLQQQQNQQPETHKKAVSAALPSGGHGHARRCWATAGYAATTWRKPGSGHHVAEITAHRQNLYLLHIPSAAPVWSRNGRLASDDQRPFVVVWAWAGRSDPVWAAHTTHEQETHASKIHHHMTTSFGCFDTY